MSSIARETLPEVVIVMVAASVSDLVEGNVALMEQLGVAMPMTGAGLIGGVPVTGLSGFSAPCAGAVTVTVTDTDTAMASASKGSARQVINASEPTCNRSNLKSADRGIATSQNPEISTKMCYSISLA